MATEIIILIITNIAVPIIVAFITAIAQSKKYKKEIQLLNAEHDIDMQFYNSYFASIIKQLVSDLADGTLKLTIGDSDLEEYYIDYIPYDKQQSFVKNSSEEVNKLKKQLASAEKNLQENILKLL